MNFTATGKNDDIQGPKCQSGNVDGIDIDNAEPKLDDNLAVLVSAEDLGEYKYSVIKYKGVLLIVQDIIFTLLYCNLK